MKHTIELSITEQVTLDGRVIASINDPSILAFWVKIKSHGITEIRLTKLRDVAASWGFGTARFDSAMDGLIKAGLVEVARAEYGRKWVHVA